MAQGDDDQHDPLHQAGSIYDDDLEDSTMEISLQDIYALSKVDQRSPQAQDVSNLSHMAPPPAPAGSASVHDPMTVELDEDLLEDEVIELEGEVLTELTSEVFDEEDYDLIQKNFEEIDGLVEPTLFPDESSAAPDELDNTGVLEQSYEDLLGDEFSSLEDDTDPSVDLYLPELGDPVSLAQEDPSEAFDSMEELSHEQFAGDVEEPEESWVDSTSVFSPDEALLEAARGAFAEQISGAQPVNMPQDTEHMIDIPILAVIPDDKAIEEDATGMFEVPAALLSQLRQPTPVEEREPPPALVPQADDDATIQGAIETSSMTVPPFEVHAYINNEGHVIIPSHQAMAAHLKPGLRLRLLVEILHDD